MDRSPPLDELFLVLERFRSRFARHLATFADTLSADQLGAECRHCAATDTALVVVCQAGDPASRRALASVVRAAREANVAILEPSRLTESDRQSFYEHYLPHYEQRVGRCRSVSEALARMGERLDIPVTVADDPLPFAEGTRTDGALARRPQPASGTDLQPVGALRRAGTDARAGTGEPVPARAAPRFAIRWPVTLLAGASIRMTLSVRDISRRGMFIATCHEIPTREVGFVLPHDTGSRPILGHARVVRSVEEPTASQRGLERGVAIEIARLRGEHESRLAQLVERIARRSASRILVGAPFERAASIARDLGAAGYVVIAAETPTEFRRAATELPAFDLALLDDRLSADPAERRALRQLLGGRIRCVPLPASRPPPTRAAIDLLLRVVTLR